jgi:uncharacterized membrane-anchored protein YitT (DUF2179 family)
VTTPIRHTLFEDFQALLAAPLMVALSVLMFREAGLLTGGTTGLAFLAHYGLDLPFGPAFFVINLPFYFFAVRTLGWAFTIKTFLSVALLSLYTEVLPAYIGFSHLNPALAAVMGGFLTGIGLLMLIRHRASLGGLGVMAVYLQERRGWRAGHVQMAADVLILASALLVRDLHHVALSILGALALNFVIAVNHRPGRYMGT